MRFSVADFLSYVFYLPLFFTGPIYTFDRFYKEVWNISKVVRIISFSKVAVQMWNNCIYSIWDVCECRIRFIWFQMHVPMKPWTRKTIVPLAKDIIRVAFWTLFMEVWLHYFYFYSIQHHHTIMRYAIFLHLKYKWTTEDFTNLRFTRKKTQYFSERYHIGR